MRIPSNQSPEILPYFSALKKAEADQPNSLRKNTTNEKIRDFFHMKSKLDPTKSPYSDQHLKNSINFQLDYKRCTDTLRDIDKVINSSGKNVEAHVKKLKDVLETAEKYEKVLKGIDKIIKGSKLMTFIRSEARSGIIKGPLKHSSDFTKLSHEFNEKINSLQFLKNLKGAENYFKKLEFQLNGLRISKNLSAISPKDFETQKKRIEDQLNFLNAYVLSKQNDLTYDKNPEDIQSFSQKVSDFIDLSKLDRSSQ